MTTDDLIAYIANHTYLLLAGLDDPTHEAEQAKRHQQVIGMLQLARAAELDPRLQAFLAELCDRLA